MENDPAISEEVLHQGLAETVAAFERHAIAYALIGGIAVSFRSQPRFTKDLDFLLAVPTLSLPPLLEDLAGRGFTFDESATVRDWTRHHMVVLDYRGIRID